jgi:hypothetical protein
MVSSYAVLGASLTWCVVALCLEVIHAMTLGMHHAHAPARGSAWRGLAYAFGPGMLPWHKDGARLHPGVFVSGLIYHVGVFAGLASVVSVLAGVEVPRASALVIGALAVSGVAGGIVMLARRVESPALRRISAPDDYASNVLVSLFLGAVAIHAWQPDRVAALVVTATVLFAYAPLGKIRHCVFFPLARGAFAVTFGRRGVLGRPDGRRVALAGELDGPDGGGCG